VLERDVDCGVPVTRDHSGFSTRYNGPEYTAFELGRFGAYRGLLSVDSDYTKMEAFLSRHARLEPPRGKAKNPSLVVDVRGARRHLEAKIKDENLGFTDRFLARRAFRSTVDRLHAQGAKQKGVGQITLNWKQRNRFLNRKAPWSSTQNERSQQVASPHRLKQQSITQYLHDINVPEAHRADFRLSQIVAMGEQKRTTILYNPEKHGGNLAKQHRRYLTKLVQDEHNPGVKLKNGCFVINREKALTAISVRRNAEQVYLLKQGETAKLHASVVERYRRFGIPEPDGSRLLDTSKAKDQGKLIWSLERAAVENPGSVKLEKPGVYSLSLEQCQQHHFPGTRKWAEQMPERYPGLNREVSGLRLRPEALLQVRIKGNPDKNTAPLRDDLAPSTKATYSSVSKRLADIPVEQLPKYLAERSDTLSKSGWWVEHGCARRQLRALEMVAGKQGNHALRQQLFEVRSGLEKMQWSACRSVSLSPKQNAAKQPIDSQVFEHLLENTRRSDLELHDSLVITNATGLRPAELQQGVRLSHVAGNTFNVHISTAKKAEGLAGEGALFAVDKGIDRTLEVTDHRLIEVAARHDGYFVPESSKDHLRLRLVEARKDVPGAENISAYSFRNQFKSNLENQGLERSEIALRMGHKSERSQDEYTVEI